MIDIRSSSLYSFWHNVKETIIIRQSKYTWYWDYLRLQLCDCLPEEKTLKRMWSMAFAGEDRSTNSTYKAITRYSILEYDESRQRLYSVFISNAWVLLSVNFHHLDFIFQWSTDFIEDRNHKLTWATPVR